MQCRAVFLLACLAVTACSSPAEVTERTAAEEPAVARASASAKGAAKAVAEETDLYSYELSYPAAVWAIAPLAAKIDGDAKRARDELIADARSARSDAQASGYPYNPHSLIEKWEVVADLPGFLSLSNNFATYSGGAHGMYGMTGLIWDKANGRGFAPEELFQSPAYLGSVMGDTLCAALNAERVKKGIDLPSEKDPIFPRCPALDEATVLVGSSNGKTFDRITVWYGPYVAGSYAEGAYELDFPMTAAMIEAVKPAYRAAFSAGK